MPGHINESTSRQLLISFNLRASMHRTEGGVMSKVQQIERDVQSLSPSELASFREWFRQFDAEAWDRQIEEDVKAGKLDDLANAALKSHQAGKSTDL